TAPPPRAGPPRPAWRGGSRRPSSRLRLQALTNLRPPSDRRREDRRPFDREAPAVGEQTLPVDPHVGYVRRLRRIDECRVHVLERLFVRRTRIYSDHVGAFAGLERAGLLSEAEDARALPRRGGDELASRECSRVVRRDLRELAGKIHGLEHREVVVRAGGSIGPEPPEEAVLLPRRDVRDAGRELHVRLRVVGEADAVLLDESTVRGVHP